ncbi:hypothetical protein [Pseudarthrobacter sp. NPDC058119]|uniref:hypothetical protein n=1 Tax=Pseudarthrobacter sp. NPDC058119 TaxID=3346348 RepID=UPI0036D8BC1E
MKASITFAVYAAAVLFVGACSAQGSLQLPSKGPDPVIQHEITTKLIVSAGGAKAVTVEDVSAGPRVEAKVAGKVSRDGAGCVTLLASDGDDWTLLFPPGTTFRGEAVVLPDGTSLAQGDPVTLDGNRGPANDGASMCLNYARLLSVDAAAVGAGG